MRHVVPRPARASAFGLLSLLPVLLLVPAKAFSAPADTVSTANATFDADALNAPPDGTLPGPPAGDSLTIGQSSGTVRVRASVGTLTSKPVEMNQVPGTGSMNMHVYPVAVTGCDRATVRWRSLARTDTVCFLACVLRGPGGGIIASAEYRAGGVMTYNSTGGPLTPLPVSYTPDVDQRFSIDVDFAAQTSSISVDGVAMTGFQNVPFVSPDAITAIETIGFEAGCTSAQVFAVDEISAVAICAQPDQPPTLVAPAVANGEEGGTISFSVSASDPDGDPLDAITADLSGLPESDASFTVNESTTAGTFLWHPQVGDSGAYAVTFRAVNALTTVATTQINVGPTGTSVTGTLVWVTHPGQEGTYDVIFTASNPAGETGSATTHITVTSGAAAAAPAPAHPPLAAQLPQKGPIVRAPEGVSVAAGDTVVVVVTATDADELPPPPPPTGAAGLPRRASAIVVTALTLTADLSRLPEGNNATFTVDRQPEVVVPGTVYATDGSTLHIHITASDPDGDPILAISADTSLLPPGQATFVTDMHTTGDLTWNIPPGQVGTYTVTFSSSNALSGKATTTIFVSTVLQARAFQPGQDKKIKLRTLRPLACMRLPCRAIREWTGWDMAGPIESVRISSATSRGRLRWIRCHRSSAPGYPSRRPLASINHCSGVDSPCRTSTTASASLA